MFSKSKIFLFNYSVFLILFRLPEFILEPRFWAEEATVFLVNAYQKPFLEMLFVPLVGYSTFTNTILSNLCLLVPLEYAPLITTYFCFSIQLISCSIIIFKDFVLWNHFAKKFFLVSLMILITPFEIWLNTTNIHIHYGLILFLISISFSDKDNLFTKISFRVLAFIGTISSPSAAFSGLIFFIRMLKEKTRESFIQFFIILVSSILQGSAILYSYLYNNKYSRFTNFDFAEFFEYYFRDSFGLLLFFDEDKIFIISIFISIYVFYLFYSNFQLEVVKYLLISFIIISVLSIIGSLKMQGSPRYSYIPSVILILLFLNHIFKFKKMISIPFFLFITYFILQVVQANYNKNSFYRISFPSWKAEIKKFKNDNSYRIKVHPFHKPDVLWEIDFNKKLK